MGSWLKYEVPESSPSSTSITRIGSEPQNHRHISALTKPAAVFQIFDRGCVSGFRFFRDFGVDRKRRGTGLWQPVRHRHRRRRPQQLHFKPSTVLSRCQALKVLPSSSFNYLFAAFDFNKVVIHEQL